MKVCFVTWNFLQSCLINTNITVCTLIKEQVPKTKQLIWLAFLVTDSTAPLPQLSPFISSNLSSMRTESSWLRGSFVAVFLIFLRCEILMFHDFFIVIIFLPVLTPTSVLAWKEKVGWVERGFTKTFKERVAAGSKDSLAFTTTLKPHSIVWPCTEMLILLCSSPFTRASFSPLLFSLLIDTVG